MILVTIRFEVPDQWKDRHFIERCLKEGLEANGLDTSDLPVLIWMEHK